MTTPEHPSAYIPVSHELIEDAVSMHDAIRGMLDGTWTPPPPKPAPPTPALHLALHDATDGALRAVIEQHAPTRELGSWVCRGCDTGTYAESNPSWPCSTVDLIAEKLDIRAEEPS